MHLDYKWRGKNCTKKDRGLYTTKYGLANGLKIVVEWNVKEWCDIGQCVIGWNQPSAN